MTENLLFLKLLLSTVLWCASLANGAEGVTSPKPMSNPDGQWTLQSGFSDEFNQAQLDTTKWDSDPQDWGVWSWEPQNAWVKDGHLHLRIQYHEHMRGTKTLFYSSGIIKSKARPIKYGYFEARIKAAPRFPGVCPAFWAYRSDKDSWTEIDFAELTEVANNVRRIDTNLHAFQHPDLFDGKRRQPGKHHAERRHWDAPWDPRKDFHVYGCEWDKKSISWYIDGKLVNRADNRYWQYPLDMALSFGLRQPLKSKASKKGFPTVFQVDYVRVWKKASPNKTDAGEGK